MIKFPVRMGVWGTEELHTHFRVKLDGGGGVVGMKTSEFYAAHNWEQRNCLGISGKMDKRNLPEV